MNKADLIDSVSASANLSKADATRAVDAIFNGIVTALKSDQVVTIVGFGAFKKTLRKARIGRNPRTKEPINIPASNTGSFRAGKGLKDALN